METKTCTKCGETKALEAFRAAALGKLGRTAECAVCLTTRSREHRERNRERVRAQQAQYRDRNRDARNAAERTRRLLQKFSDAAGLNDAKEAQARDRDDALIAASYKVAFGSHVRVAPSPCHLRDVARRKKKSRVERLSGAYVRSKLAEMFGVSAAQIPDDLVEAKRLSITLTRAIREIDLTLERNA
jgi:hypothetical protein